MLFACPICRSRYWFPSRRAACARSHRRPVGPPPLDHPNCRCQVVPFVTNAAPEGPPPPHWVGRTYDPLNIEVVSLGLDQPDFTDRSSGGSCDATDWSGGGGDSGGSGASSSWD